MRDAMSSPCPEWADKLADFHSNNLSSPDREALNRHLASCEACAAVLREYQDLDESLHRVLSSKPLPFFSPQLLNGIPQKRKQSFEMQPVSVVMAVIAILALTAAVLLILMGQGGIHENIIVALFFLAFALIMLVMLLHLPSFLQKHQLWSSARSQSPPVRSSVVSTVPLRLGRGTENASPEEPAGHLVDDDRTATVTEAPKDVDPHSGQASHQSPVVPSLAWTGASGYTGETLNILFSKGEKGTYELQIKDSWSGHVEKSQFVPPYPPKQLDVLLRKINILEIDGEELREIGHRLFLALGGSETTRTTHTEQPSSLIQAILRGSIQRTLRDYGTIALTLSFAPDCEELMRYPWELLHNGEHFLLASGVFTLTRTLLNPEMPAESELPVSPPIRLLYIGASPSDRLHLETERSFEALKRGLARLIEDGYVLVDELQPPTFDELVRYLDSFGSMDTALDNETSIPCYVVHFDGHGASGRLCPAGDCNTLNDADARKCVDCGMPLDHVTTQTYLCFCDDQGRNRYIGTEALCELFLKSDVRMAVFAACETAMLPEEDRRHRHRRAAVDTTLATALVKAQVPAVVAMPSFLQDDLSPTFTFHFYEALAHGRTLEEALVRARQALLPSKHSSWFVPVLYRSITEGQEGPVPLLAGREKVEEREAPIVRSSAFVGREQELSELSSLLAQAVGSDEQAPAFNGQHTLNPDTHLIAITGPAGIGKSALTFAVVQHNRKNFPGGVLSISLQGGKSFGEALIEIARHLGISTRSMYSANLAHCEQLVLNGFRSLAGRDLPCLLVLDRFDEVQERTAVGIWHRFLSALPKQVVVLLTSHSNPQNVAMLEDAPYPWYEYRLDEMANQDLLRLFIKLAEDSGLAERIHLNEPQQQAILQEICTLLDGYPLGAELIFGRVRIGDKVYQPEAATRSLEEVRDELRNTQLEGIWAVLVVAYKLLNEPARLLLPYLATFKLPFSHQQIAMLVEPQTAATHRTAMRMDSEHEQGDMHTGAQEGPVEETSTIPPDLQKNWRSARDELVDASFVRFDGRLYNIHIQIRKFAHTLLPEEERRRVHRIAAAYYGGLPHPTPEEWLVAFEHMEEAGEPEDLHKAIHLAINAAKALGSRGRASELQAMLRRAERYALKLDDKTGEGQIQRHLGAILRQRGKYAEAFACLTRSLELQREQHEQDEQAWVLFELAMLFREEGQYQKASEYARQALDLFGEVSDTRGKAWMHLILGEVSRDYGRYAEAEEHVQIALASFLDLGSDEGHASVLRVRGTIHEAFGRYAAALADYEESLRLFTALGLRLWQAWVLINQSIVYLDQDKLDRAEQTCREVMSIFREQKVLRGEAWALRVMGDIARKRGQFAEAKSYYDEANGIFTELSDRIDQARTMNARGAIAFEEGAYPLAKEYYEHALAIAREQAVHQLEVRALRGLGDVARVMHHLTDADRYYHEAATLASQLHTPAEQCAVLHRQGELYLLQGLYREALDAWIQALTLDQRIDHPERIAIEGKAEKLVAEQHLEEVYAELWNLYGLC
jgi:tetratricopeptide (TPR) repeat protein